jgi:hypothetical protein
MAGGGGKLLAGNEPDLSSYVTLTGSWASGAKGKAKQKFTLIISKAEGSRNREFLPIYKDLLLFLKGVVRCVLCVVFSAGKSPN